MQARAGRLAGMGIRASTQDLLRRWGPPGDRQAALRDEALARLHSVDDFLWREGVPVHLTASVLILDRCTQDVLLVHHAKAGRWQFPGGHCERQDASLKVAARREVHEETGLTVTLKGLLALDAGPAVCGLADLSVLGDRLWRLAGSWLRHVPGSPSPRLQRFRR